MKRRYTWLCLIVLLALSGCVSSKDLYIHADDLNRVRKKYTDAEIVQYRFIPGDPDILEIIIPDPQKKVFSKSDSPIDFETIVIDLETEEVIERRHGGMLLH